MARLAAVLEPAAHAALPDGQKEFYVESNGKFVLDMDVESHPGVAGLKSTVAATRQERERLEGELKKFKELGDVDKAKEALAAIQKMEEDAAKKAGEFDKLKGQLIEKHGNETKALNAQLSEKDKDIETLVLDRAILEVLGLEDVKGNPKILLPHMRSRVKAVKEGGEWKAVVHDGKGNITPADGVGTAMTIKQLAVEMKKDPDYAPNFASTSKSGSGTPPGAGAGGGPTGGGGAKTQVKKSDTNALSAPGMIEKINKGEVEVVD